MAPPVNQIVRNSFRATTFDMLFNVKAADEGIFLVYRGNRDLSQEYAFNRREYREMPLRGQENKLSRTWTFKLVINRAELGQISMKPFSHAQIKGFRFGLEMRNIV